MRVRQEQAVMPARRGQAAVRVRREAAAELAKTAAVGCAVVIPAVTHPAPADPPGRHRRRNEMTSIEFLGRRQL